MSDSIEKIMSAPSPERRVVEKMRVEFEVRGDSAAQLHKLARDRMFELAGTDYPWRIAEMRVVPLEEVIGRSHEGFPVVTLFGWRAEVRGYISIEP